MNEARDVVVSLWPDGGLALAREPGALKGLRKGQWLAALLRGRSSSGGRALAARARGPSPEGEPVGPVGRGRIAAAAEVVRLAAGLVPRPGSRTGGACWRPMAVSRSGHSTRRRCRNRAAVAPARQRASSAACWRLLQAHGDRGAGGGRDLPPFARRRGRLRAGRPMRPLRASPMWGLRAVRSLCR